MEGPQLRIGLDLDGVLADFNSAFSNLILDRYGIACGPPVVWDWPEYYGVTSEQVKTLFAWIETHPEWWISLKPEDDAQEAVDSVRSWILADKADCYVITSRPGRRTHFYSQRWVSRHVAPHVPVLMADRPLHKGLLAQGLGLTHFLDDKPVNVEAVRQASPGTASLLLSRPWNLGAPGQRIPHVRSLLQWKSV